MSGHLRPIDDPEVRAQHRRQLRQDLKTCLVGVTIAVTFLAGLPALCLLGQYLRADRTSVTVTAIDPDREVLMVWSASFGPETTTRYEVEDAATYELGDDLVLVEFDDESTPILERAPLRGLVLAALKFAGKLFLVGMALGTVGALCLAHRRRRSLRRPWRRAQVEVVQVDPDSYARIPSIDHGSAWKLADTPVELRVSAIREAQLAGTSKHLVLRFFGSTQLVRATRVGALPSVAQPTGESAMSEPRCTSVGVSDPRSSSSCLASRK